MELTSPVVAKLSSAESLDARLCPPEIGVEPHFRRSKTLVKIGDTMCSTNIICVFYRRMFARLVTNTPTSSNSLKNKIIHAQSWKLLYSEGSLSIGYHVECTVILQLEYLPVTQVHLTQHASQPALGLSPTNPLLLARPMLNESIRPGYYNQT